MKNASIPIAPKMRWDCFIIVTVRSHVETVLTQVWFEQWLNLKKHYVALRNQLLLFYDLQKLFYLTKFRWCYIFSYDLQITAIIYVLATSQWGWANTVIVTVSHHRFVRKSTRWKISLRRWGVRTPLTCGRALKKTRCELVMTCATTNPRTWLDLHWRFYQLDCL